MSEVWYLLGFAGLSGLTAVLFWPGRGLWPRWQEGRRLTRRVQREDALKYIHKQEIKGAPLTMESIAGILQINLNATAGLLEEMQTDQLLTMHAGEINLTPAGRDSALHIIRAHRLWESYLATETGFAQEEWHGQAEVYEHLLTPVEVAALANQLGHPTHDPHGDPIPGPGGAVVFHGGEPVTKLPLDQLGQIVHLEDEPDIVYAQLVAEGLHPGQTIRVTEATPQRIRFWTNGDEHLVAPIVARNISVVPLQPEEAKLPPACERLSALHPGETAVVVNLSPTCRGAERRRFLDLGILPGTQITAEMSSPGGDPTAYQIQIRGALIALRREQADLIKVQKQAD